MSQEPTSVGSHLLKVQDLSVRFKTPTGHFDAVKNVNFTLNKGKSLALVGEFGSGKSVTALSILQLLPYPLASHPTGSIKFQGKEIIGLNHKQLMSIRGDKISMIFQEPMTSLNPLHTLYKQIAEIIKLHYPSSGKDEIEQRVIDLLDLVGLPKLKNRMGSYPHELSGGQRQRMMIAMALANSPDLLIADEPTTALDVTIQAQILELLEDLRQRLDMAMILISHDLKVVKKMCDDICVMKQGEIIEHEKREVIFDTPKQAYTKTLLSSQPRQLPYSTKEDTKTILRADHINVRFPIKKDLLGRSTKFVHAVNDISLSLREKNTLGIVGEFGSGKTTLGLALLRLIKSTGTIEFDGNNINTLKRKFLPRIRADMQIVFQDPYGSLSPRMSIENIIGEGLDVHEPHTSKKDREEKIIEALVNVDLNPDTRHRYPHEFSGGQRQRISIARALVLKPKLIILDEPTSALDVSVQAQIVELLQDLQEKYNLSYLFISHDLNVVRAMSHNILVMKDGKMVEYGSTQQIFDTPKETYTKNLMEAALNLRTKKTA